MKKPDSSLKLPKRFLEQYRKNILIRSLGSVVLLAVGVFLCTVLDFSASKYPEAGMIFVVFAAFVLACLFFRFDLIVFKRSWIGEIKDIKAKKERRVKVHASYWMRERMIVHLYIDRGEVELYDCELWHEGMEHSAKRTVDGASGYVAENKYQTQAPFKIDDTIVYLRGMKYPFRYNVKTEGMFDVLFVCPYCGEINKAERDDCYRCRRTLVK